MTSAFAFLISRTTWNGLRVRARRLRQPRYALGSIAAAGYFLLIATTSGGYALTGAGVPRAHLEPLMAGALFVMLALLWIWPSRKGPTLGFTEPEVHHLFPAPITRRQLVMYRVARTQMAATIPALILTLFASPSGLARWVASAVGLWLLFGLVGVQGMLVSLSREALSRAGWRAHMRRWAPAVLFGAALAALVAPFIADFERIAALPEAMPRAIAVAEQLESGASAVILWPFRALVRVVLAEDLRALLLAIGPATLIWLASAAWLVRSDAAFEEASADKAAKVARILAGRGNAFKTATKVRPALFKLRPSGRVETALLWKNLIMIGRIPRQALVSAAVGLAIVILVFGVLDDDGSSSNAVAGVLQILAVLTVFQGPIMARFDLRQDLAHLAEIKGWPVPGAVVVRGQVLAPILLLSAIVWVLILAGAVLGETPFSGDDAATTFETASWTTALLLALPAIISVQVVIQNGIAVMFPAWIKLGHRTPGGMDAMGQTMVMMLVAVLAGLVAILPAVIAGALAGLASKLALGWVPVLVPAAVGVSVLAAECWIATAVIGRTLDATDIGAIDAAQG